MNAKTNLSVTSVALLFLWGCGAPPGSMTSGADAGSSKPESRMAVGGCVTVAGAVYAGTGTVTYTLDALGEPVVHRNAVLAPLAPALSPAANNARVMIQDMHTGAVVTYGTFPDPAANLWSACLPAGGVYIAMYSATDHDLTSRVFDLTGDVTIYSTLVTDAYLPALYLNKDTGVVDPVTEPIQPLGNLLVYAFEENEVNGAPDWPTDPGLPGVLMELYDPRTGNVVASGYTAAGGPGAPTINTKDGLAFTGDAVSGLLYLQDIPPGAYALRATPPATDAAGNAWANGWYHTYTMEGTREWEILIYPGDPGTEAGAFLAWFGFVKKLGQLPVGTGGSTISGTVEDADIQWEPPIVGGEPEPPEAGAPLDPIYINQGVSTHLIVPDAFLVLWRRIGDVSTVIATTEADPVDGTFSFENVPAGIYTLLVSDKPLQWVFGEVQVAVDGVNDVAFPLFINETAGMPKMVLPRFAARLNGFVVDNATGIGIPGATVNLQYQGGNVPFSVVTDATGWYGFEFLGEIETMAFFDVEPPPGYRGAIVTDTYWPQAGVPVDPNCTGFANCPIVSDPCNPSTDQGCVICGYDVNGTPIACDAANGTVIQRNGMNRWVQYYTANYTSSLFLEPIPADVGQIQGMVFGDSLARGTWVGDGLYDKVEDSVVEDATIELLDAAGGIIPLLDAGTGLPVIDPVTLEQVQDPATVTASGAYDETVAVAQGYIAIGVPPDEWGGFFSGPKPGSYEFRDVAPGTYTLRLTLPYGFHATGEVVVQCVTAPCLPAYVDQTVIVAGGARNDVDFGIHTLVPRAGKMEGGVFDDTFLDHRWYSAFSEEKQLLVGIGVVTRDYLGYVLDTMVQPSAVCYEGTTPLDPTVAPLPFGAICDRPDLGADVEIDRLVAPGLRLYWGNDPTLPECTAGNLNSPCQDPTLSNLELPYTMGQGLAKFEADWSLPAALPGVGPPPVCTNAVMVTTLSGSSFYTEGTKWRAAVSLTVEDAIGPLPGSMVTVAWSNGEGSEAITNGNGQATLVLETVEDENLDSVTATVSITPGEGGFGAFNPVCGAGDCLIVNRPDIGGTATCGGPPAPFCGDGTCDAGEDHCNCTADCGLPTIEICIDGVDNDCNGAIDCADTACCGVGPCGACAFCGDGTCDPGEDLCGCPVDCGPIPAESCTDGADNDCDGLADCDDLDCAADVACIVPVCGDGICDPAEDLCGCPVDCGPIPAENCTDGADNDCDGLADCADADCAADPACAPPPAGAVIIAAMNGAGIDKGEGKWFAQVTFTVEGPGGPLANVQVRCRFTGGEAKWKTTNGNGQISRKSETFEGGPNSVTFTVTNVNHPDYDAGASLTSITINRP